MTTVGALDDRGGGRSGVVCVVGSAAGCADAIAAEAVPELARADIIVYDRSCRVVVLNYGNPQAEWREVELGVEVGCAFPAGDRGAGGCPVAEAIVAAARRGAYVVRLRQEEDMKGRGDGDAELRALAAAGVPCRVIAGPLAPSKWIGTEQPPLVGRRILVTRPRGQGEELCRYIVALGGEVVRFPTIRIVDPPDWGPFDRASDRIGDYDWVVFTSANGVRAVRERLRVRGGDVRDWRGIKLAAIGPATARCLQEANLRVDAVPREYRSEALAEALIARGDLTGVRILLLRALEGRTVLPAMLRRRGALVDDVPVYQTVPDGKGASIVEALLDEGHIHVVTFTSPSTVRYFRSSVAQAAERLARFHVRVACVGPVTAEAAAAEGFTVHAVAEDYTAEGLARAVAALGRRDGFR